MNNPPKEELKEKTLVLELSDTEKTRFFDLCAGVGMTPDKVLEGFVFDLVGGQRSHGSDEGRLADEYFDRTYLPAPQTFGAWLIREDKLAFTLYAMNALEEWQEYLETLPEDFEGEELDEEKQKCLAEMEGFKRYLESDFEKYQREADFPASKSLEEGLKSIIELVEARRAF